MTVLKAQMKTLARYEKENLDPTLDGNNRIRVSSDNIPDSIDEAHCIVTSRIKFFDSEMGSHEFSEFMGKDLQHIEKDWLNEKTKFISSRMKVKNCQDLKRILQIDGDGYIKRIKYKLRRPDHNQEVCEQILRTFSENEPPLDHLEKVGVAAYKSKTTWCTLPKDNSLSSRLFSACSGLYSRFSPTKPKSHN